MADETEQVLQHHELLLESRENTHISAFIQHYDGAEAEDLVRKTYYEHGHANGRKAVRHLGPSDRDIKAAVDTLVR